MDHLRTSRKFNIQWTTGEILHYNCWRFDLTITEGNLKVTLKDTMIIVRNCIPTTHSTNVYLEVGWILVI